MPLVTNIPKSEAKWSKFKSSYMWGNKEYYLRRSKLAASIALTYVAVSNGVKIHGVSAAEEASIRASWTGPALGYKNYTLLLVVLGLSWLQWIFVTWR